MLFAMVGGAGLGLNGLAVLLTGEALVMLVLGVLLSVPLFTGCRKIPGWIVWCGCVILFVLCLLRLANSGFTPFIYAQF